MVVADPKVKFDRVVNQFKYGVEEKPRKNGNKGNRHGNNHFVVSANKQLGGPKKSHRSCTWWWFAWVIIPGACGLRLSMVVLDHW